MKFIIVVESSNTLLRDNEVRMVSTLLKRKLCVVVILDTIFNRFDFFCVQILMTNNVNDDPKKIMDQVAVWFFSVTVIICTS